MCAPNRPSGRRCAPRARRVGADVRPGPAEWAQMYAARSAPTRPGSPDDLRRLGVITPHICAHSAWIKRRSAPTRRQRRRAVAMAARPSPRPVRPEAVGGGGGEGERGAEGGGQGRLGLGAARAHLRAVAQHLHGDVADLEAGGAHPARGLGEQRDARRRRPTPGSAVPKLDPRSPSPEADSSASQAACAATSPSECPSSPCGSSGQASPARCSGTPSANRWTSVPMPMRGTPGVRFTG